MPHIYLDSCIVIYLFEGPEALSKEIDSYLRPEQDPAPKVFVSPLTRLECRIHPLREDDAELLQKYDSFFNAPEITTIPMTDNIFDRAAQIRAHDRLKTPDALHLAAAIGAECDTFCTNDTAFNKASGNMRLKVFG